MRFAGDKINQQGAEQQQRAAVEPDWSKIPQGGGGTNKPFNRQQNFRQGQKSQRQGFQERRKQDRSMQRQELQNMRESGASRQQMRETRQKFRDTNKANRQGFKQGMQRNRQNHRANMKNDRALNRHFESSGQPGFSAITEYKDNRTGKIVRTPNSSYAPKNSDRWSKVEPEQMNIIHGDGGGAPQYKGGGGSQPTSMFGM